MLALVGETRAKVMRSHAISRGYGVLVVRGRMQTAAIDLWPLWAYDNKVFSDWIAGRDFDEARYFADLLLIVDRIQAGKSAPLFVVLPDIVAGGLYSLGWSLSWLWRVGRLPLPWALVVQDGMTPDDIPWDAPFSHVFVGGSKAWKLATMAEWVRAARAHDKKCHVGRMGTGVAVRWAKACGVDSIDSAVPVIAKKNMDVFDAAMQEEVQCSWGWVGIPSARTVQRGRTWGAK